MDLWVRRETKLQSSQWRSPSSPCPKESKISPIKCEKDAHCFLCIQVLVHYESVPAGRTANQHYKEVLLRLREKVKRQQSQLFQSGR
jgi:hypothetical protein